MGIAKTRLATVVTTSAMSLTLLGTMQNEMQAQNQQQPQQVNAQKGQLTDDQAVNKFFNFGYNYCDAKVLASYWNQEDPYEMKITMGHKLWNQTEKDIDELVRTARSEALQKADGNLPAYYDDGGYSYDDAELLAGYWGSADTYESKMTMSRLLIGGHDKVLKAALKSARR